MADDDRRFDWRATVRSFLEILGLTALAVTQPVLDVFGRAPEAFIAHDADSGDVIAFALLIALVPAIALWALVTVVRLANPAVGRAVRVGVVVSLVALFALQVLKEVVGVDGLLLALLTALAGVGALFAYRLAAVRQAMVYLAVAPALFVGVFLVSSPTSDLLRSDDIDAADIGEEGSDRSVVMVVWDEWPLNSIIDRTGAIDADLYPNLAALAADGAFYRNATTVATATTSAVPSLLTGRYATDGASPTAADHPENLFTLLASQYDLEATESATALCPDALCAGPFIDDPEAEGAPSDPAPSSGNALRELLDDALHSYREMVALDDDAGGPVPIDEDTRTVTSATVAPGSGQDDAVDEARNDDTGGIPFPVLQLSEFRRFLDSIEEGEDPALHFLHVQLPHSPYRFLPDGRAYAEGGIDPDELAEILEERGPEPYATAFDRQRLQLQVGYVDRLVGQLMNRLRRTGLYRDTTVILTSDHGKGFVPGESHRAFEGDVLDESLYPDLLYVPLIVKAPGIEPATVSDANVESIDIVPTVADVLDIEIPWSVDGQSLFGPERTTSEKRFNKAVTPEGATAAFGGAAELAPTTTFDGDEYFAANLARHVGTLLVGDNPDHPLYGLVADGDLVGQDVADLDVGDPSEAALVVEEGVDDLEAYDGTTSIVPVRITGELQDGPAGEVTVAIAVDGVIAAVVPTYPEGDVTHRVDAMLDPSALDSTSSHEVAAFLVTGQGRARRLLPLG